MKTSTALIFLAAILAFVKCEKPAARVISALSQMKPESQDNGNVALRRTTAHSPSGRKITFQNGVKVTWHPGYSNLMVVRVYEALLETGKKEDAFDMTRIEDLQYALIPLEADDRSVHTGSRILNRIHAHADGAELWTAESTSFVNDHFSDIQKKRIWDVQLSFPQLGDSLLLSDWEQTHYLMIFQHKASSIATYLVPAFGVGLLKPDTVTDMLDSPKDGRYTSFDSLTPKPRLFYFTSRRTITSEILRPWYFLRFLFPRWKNMEARERETQSTIATYYKHAIDQQSLAIQSSELLQSIYKTAQDNAEVTKPREDAENFAGDMAPRVAPPRANYVSLSDIRRVRFN